MPLVSGVVGEARSSIALVYGGFLICRTELLVVDQDVAVGGLGRGFASMVGNGFEFMRDGSNGTLDASGENKEIFIC